MSGPKKTAPARQRQAHCSRAHRSPARQNSSTSTAHSPVRPGTKNGKLIEFRPANFVLGTARVAASHFSVTVRRSSQLFVAGPPVVKFGVGEDLTKEELGGSHIHAYLSGAVDNEAGSEDQAFANIRRFLSPPAAAAGRYIRDRPRSLAHL
jgi:hypothetical protein